MWLLVIIIFGAVLGWYLSKKSIYQVVRRLFFVGIAGGLLCLVLVPLGLSPHDFSVIILHFIIFCICVIGGWLIAVALQPAAVSSDTQRG